VCGQRRGVVERRRGDAAVNSKAPLQVEGFGLCLSGPPKPNRPARGRLCLTGAPGHRVGHTARAETTADARAPGAEEG